MLRFSIDLSDNALRRKYKIYCKQFHPYFPSCFTSEKANKNTAKNMGIDLYFASPARIF